MGCYGILLCQESGGGGSFLNVEYDDAVPADCDDDDAAGGAGAAPTGRRFSGARRVDDDRCFDIEYTLSEGGSRYVSVSSCPHDGSELKIELVGGGGGGSGGFSDDERDFFCVSASTIESDASNDVITNVNTLESQVVRSARTLCEWPRDVPVSYDWQVDGGGGGSGREVELIPEDDPSMPWNGNRRRRNGRRGRKLLKRRVTTRKLQQGDDAEEDSTTIHSLCDDGGSWLRSSDRVMHARIGLPADPPCVPTEGSGRGVNVWNGTAWICEDRSPDVPHYVTPPAPPPSWSYGDCFGQCGDGCRAAALSGTFTVDCADHDFCVRFGIGAVTSGGGSFDCGELFLASIDDRMWGNTCRFVGGGEFEYDGGCLAEVDSAGGGGNGGPQQSSSAIVPDLPIQPRRMPSSPMFGTWLQNSPDDYVPYTIQPIDRGVADGYDSCADLREGIKQAASYLVNEAIENNAAFDPYVYTEFYESEEFDDDFHLALPAKTPPRTAPVSAPAPAPASASTAADSSSTRLDDSYGTNNQESDVDEADLIKVAEGGRILAAAYGSNLYVLDVETLDVLAQLRYEYDDKAKVVTDDIVDPPDATRTEDFETDVPDVDGRVRFGGGIMVDEPLPLDVLEPQNGGQRKTRRTAMDEKTSKKRSRRDLLSFVIEPGYGYPYQPPEPKIVALLIEGERLVVVLSVFPSSHTYDDPDKPVLSESPVTHVRVYDIMSDEDDPSVVPPLTLVGTVDIGGNYVAGRSIGTMGHIVTSSYVDTTFHLTGYFDRFREEYADMTKEEYIVAARARYPEVVNSFVDRLTDELLSAGGSGGGSCEDIVRISSFQTLDGTSAGAGSARERDLGGADLLHIFVRIVTFDIAATPAGDGTSIGGGTGSGMGTIETEQAGVFTPYGESYVYASRDVLVVPAYGRNYDSQLDRWRDSTLLWAFALGSSGEELTAARGIGVAKVQGTTTIPGSVDQFSFDVYDGLLRVATTTRELWGCLEEEAEEGDYCRDYGVISNSTSQITVLELPDTTMPGEGGGGGEGKSTVLKEVAVIDDLGVTEQIFAVRFMNDKAFVVTFRRTDPFYSIDFADPRDPNPPVGELANITGFSNYLHPFDADGDVILAVGEETDRATGIALGLQISLFDTSDLKAPRLMHKYHEREGDDEEEGVEGFASSRAQTDHKAFRFVRRTDGSDSGVLILPVREYTYNVGRGGDDDDDNFDGFRLYDVSLQDGIKPLFDVPHATSYDIAYGCWGGGGGGGLVPRSFLVGGGEKLVTSKGHSFVKTDIGTEDTEWVLTMASEIRHDCWFDW